MRAAYDRGVLLIDPPAWPAHGRLWSHLVSDTSFEELHAFAERAGIPRRGFEGDHYDVPEERYDAVVAAGAVPTGGRELLKRLQHSGLRIPKRKHERVVLSTRDAPWLPAGGRADVIASRQDDPPPNTVVVRAVVREGRSLLLTDRADGSGVDLPSRAVAAEESARDALHLLCEDLGARAVGAHLLGYVRNVVRTPDAGYPWPVPFACFAVFTVPVAEVLVGTWCPPESQQEQLGERHWWPLVAPGAEQVMGYGSH